MSRRNIVKFEFSEKAPQPEFTGVAFYSVYKTAKFLQNDDNINRILSQGYQLRQALKAKLPGEAIVIEGMWLANNLPLIVKKTGPGVIIKDFEFTQNRLTGLVAAYAYENRRKLPKLQSEEAKTLGLTWDCNDDKKCKLYLSAVTGAEHFDQQFSYWPLVCALKKLQLKRINEESVMKIARKKNGEGIRKASLLKLNIQETQWLWKQFSGESGFNMFIKSIPPQFNYSVFKD